MSARLLNPEMPTIKYTNQISQALDIHFRLAQSSTLGLLFIQFGLFKKTHQIPVAAEYSSPRNVLRAYSKGQFFQLFGPDSLEFSVEHTRAKLSLLLQSPQNSAGDYHIYAPHPGAVSQNVMSELHRELEMAQFEDCAEFLAWFVQSRFAQVFCRSTEFELAAESLAVFMPDPQLEEIWRHWRLFLSQETPISAPA